MSQKPNVSTTLPREWRESLSNIGVEYTPIDMVIPAIETQRFLVVGREPDDVAWFGKVRKYAERSQKAVMVILTSVPGNNSYDLLAKSLISSGIHLITLPSPEHVAQFIKRLLAVEGGRASITKGEEMLSPSYLVEATGLTLPQARLVLEQFKSVEAIREATTGDLTSIKGIGDASARKIKEAFK